MSPIVRLVSGGEKYEEVFISIERTPVVMADVRRILPQLKKELRKKWPVENVQIESRIPFRRNPYDPSQIVEAACCRASSQFHLAWPQSCQQEGRGSHWR